MPLTRANFNQIKLFVSDTKPTVNKLLNFIDQHFVQETAAENMFPNKSDIDQCIHIIDNDKPIGYTRSKVRTQAESEQADAARSK